MITVKQFSASWCNPCKILTKNLEGKEGIEYIDVEDNIELSANYGIKSLPTLMFYKDHKLVEKSVGVITADQFDEIVGKWK